MTVCGVLYYCTVPLASHCMWVTAYILLRSPWIHLTCMYPTWVQQVINSGGSPYHSSFAKYSNCIFLIIIQPECEEINTIVACVEKGFPSWCVYVQWCLVFVHVIPCTQWHMLPSEEVLWVQWCCIQAHDKYGCNRWQHSNCALFSKKWGIYIISNKLYIILNATLLYIWLY